MKKFTSLFLSLILIFTLSTPAFAGSNKPIPGAPKGWKYRVDLGNTRGNENPHVHVYSPKGTEYIDGLGGKNSHKSKPKISKVPGRVRKKLEQQRDYKDAKDKANKIQALKKQLRSKHLDFSKWSDRIIAIGLVAAAGLTWFFPGDDALAWANLARVFAL